MAATLNTVNSEHAHHVFCMVDGNGWGILSWNNIVVTFADTISLVLQINVDKNLKQ